MALPYFLIAEEDMALGTKNLTAETPGKMQFDINDFSSFELDEDSLSTGSMFLDDYSSTVVSSSSLHGDYDYDNSLNSDHALRSEIEQQLDLDETLGLNYSHFNHSFNLYNSSSEPKTPTGVNDLHMEIQQELTIEDLFEVHDTTCNDDENANFTYNQPVESAPVFPDFLSGTMMHSKAALGSDKSYIHQTYGFKIFDYTHHDFNCRCPTRLGNPCKNKLTCTFHTMEDKSQIPRSDSVSNLIKNFKYLQKLHQTVYMYSKALRKRVLETDDEDGYANDDSNAGDTESEHGLQHDNIGFSDFDIESSSTKQQSFKPERLTLRSGKRLIKRHNSLQRWLHVDSAVEDFASKLQTKLRNINKDQDKRADEFHYKLELKKFAMLEYFKDKLEN